MTSRDEAWPAVIGSSGAPGMTGVSSGDTGDGAALAEVDALAGGEAVASGAGWGTLAQPVNHIMPGVYIREMHLFAGLVVVGKRHAQQHFNIVTKGPARNCALQVLALGLMRVVH